MFSKLLSTAVRRNLIQPAFACGLPQCFFTASATVEPVEEAIGEVTMKGVKISRRPLYLDMQVTSPVDPRVLDAMLPYYLSRYENPHSHSHLCSWENAIESAWAHVAALINASPKKIIFTSGATE